VDVYLFEILLFHHRDETLHPTVLLTRAHRLDAHVRGIRGDSRVHLRIGDAVHHADFTAFQTVGTGYKVRVTEFVGPEHSLKNELILAERHQRSNPIAKRELDRLVEQLGVKPALLG
jgi:CRISPR/Cas system-associated exonuclease Cas4 (RecB family)